MALKLKLALLASLAAVALVCAGCGDPGPADKHVSGKEYNDVVNSTVPKDEQNQVNTMRDSNGTVGKGGR